MEITDKFIEPLPSATVLLIRDAEKGPEVLLVLRRKETVFGANYVFPGGGVDPVDEMAEHYLNKEEKVFINRQFAVSSGGFAYYSAAIRELFEEAGILYAVSSDGTFPDHLDLDQIRNQLNMKSLCWDQFLKENQLRLNYQQLIYFAFWITPLYLSRRFTTRFFLAEIPRKQVASHCGNELIDSCWLSPKEALLARRKKEINIPHPTAITLMQIREFISTEEILAWAKQKNDLGVPCYFPELTSSEREGILL